MKAMPPIPRARGGFTLIELSVVMFVALAIAGACLAILNQQISFTRLMRSQAFLLEEGPTVNTILSRILSQSQGYRVYDTVTAAKSGGASILSDGGAVRLVFREPDGNLVEAIIGGEDPGDGTLRVGFYRNTSGSWGAQPDWTITNEAGGLAFSIENGVLRARFTGPNGGEITYSGFTQS